MVYTKKKTKSTQQATSRKATKRRKTVRSQSVNYKAQWEAYRDLQKRVDKAWATLKEKFKRKADTASLMKSKAELMLLLGECNYMARECKKCIAGQKKRKKTI